jgi:Glycosyl transferase family 64 domain.
MQTKHINKHYRSETNVFRQVLKRSQHFQYQCQTSLLPHHLGQVQPKDFDTGVPPLPEYGIQKALLQWLEKEEQQQQQEEKGQDRDYPTCQLPPSKECNVKQFTIILMSHTVSDDERLSKLHRGIQTLSSWDITGEIILVWNNLHHVLEEEHCPKRQCRDLLSWDQDPHHKLRIFYALEQDGVRLENNLLNRYHPTIQPKHEAVVYFDDDGPFHSRLAMEVGFELWKRNSDVQIGSMARNIRFPSKRMNDLQNLASDLAARLYMDGDWRLGVHPYDEEEMKQWEEHGEKEIEEKGQYQSHGYPEFTPICQKETGDVVEYNYFVFPNFKAHRG